MSQEQVIKLIVALVMALITIGSVKKGFRKGFMKELGSTLSVLLSLLCIFLIMLLYTAIKDKTYGTVITAAAALILIGLFTRIGKGIGSALTGITELTVVSWIDKVLGAVLGFAEAALFIYVFNRVMTVLGMSSFIIEIPTLIHK
jgi:uncharacterized membrane protein required for colicin V production